MLACPPSPIGITTLGMNPASSSLITGIAFIRPANAGGDQIPASVFAVEVQHVPLMVNLESQLFLRSGGVLIVRAGLKPRGSCVVPEGTRIVCSCPPSAEALGYHLPSRVAGLGSLRRDLLSRTHTSSRREQTADPSTSFGRICDLTPLRMTNSGERGCDAGLKASSPAFCCSPIAKQGRTKSANCLLKAKR